LPSELKKKMAKKVKELGGNAVSNFEIAQFGHHWLFTNSILKRKLNIYMVWARQGKYQKN